MEKGESFGPTPPEAGKSSFDLLDFEAFCTALQLSGVSTIADLGCGRGNYAIPLARRLGVNVNVWGFDLWEEGVKSVNDTAAALGIPNLKAVRADLSRLEGVADASIDLALMATVLHDLVERQEDSLCIREIARILKRGGTLAVVEFHKNESKPGPPLSVRLSAAQVESCINQYGFSTFKIIDLGPSLYLVLLHRD